MGVCLQELPLNLGAESFLTLSSDEPSVMIRLGIGNEKERMMAGLHSPHFDLDESAMKFDISATLGTL